MLPLLTPPTHAIAAICVMSLLSSPPTHPPTTLRSQITPYMHFHPGGIAELMRGAGEDATVMFQEAHAWVNFDGFLEKCLVGYMAQDRPHSTHPGVAGGGGAAARKAKPSSNSLAAPVTKPSGPPGGGLAVPRGPGLNGAGGRGKRKTAASRGSVAAGNPIGWAAAETPAADTPAHTAPSVTVAIEEPPPQQQQQTDGGGSRPMGVTVTGGATEAAPGSTGPAAGLSAPGVLPLPRRDWYQTDNAVKMVLYKVLEPPALLSNVTVHLDGNALHLSVATRAGQYRLLLVLERAVSEAAAPRLRASAGSNLTIELAKAEPGAQWQRLGNVLVRDFLARSPPAILAVLSYVCPHRSTRSACLFS